MIDKTNFNNQPIIITIIIIIIIITIIEQTTINNYQSMTINHKHWQTFRNNFYFSTQNTKQWISIYFNCLLFLKMNEKQNHNLELIYCLNYVKIYDTSVQASSFKHQASRSRIHKVQQQQQQKTHVFLLDNTNNLNT